MKVLGLMSGTSLDGLDLVLANFEGYPNSKAGVKWEIIKGKTISYQPNWKQRLNNAVNISGIELMQLHADYGVFLGKACNEFIKEAEVKPRLIASHGHTIFHEPSKGFTTQIGDGNQIAAITATDTIFDFRSLDVAKGGQGAPLVPIGDQYLFSEYDACLNLGGIANISFNENGKRVGFDICPFNLLLNHFASKLGYDYDEGGNLAKQGKVNIELLAQLSSIDFYKLGCPKSLDKETLLGEYLDIVKQFKVDSNDVLATLVKHYSTEITKHLKGKNCLITGGGAYNSYFIDILKTKTQVKIEVPTNELIDFKEALIFAFMGYLRLHNLPNVLATASDAEQSSSTGNMIIV